MKSYNEHLKGLSQEISNGNVQKSWYIPITMSIGKLY